MRKKIPKTSGIYVVESPSGSIYVGQSRDIRVRFKKYGNLGCKMQRHLYHSLVKYGVENHDFRIVKELLGGVSQDVLNEYELECWEFFTSAGFNLMNISIPGNQVRLSEETKKKIGDRHRGKPTWSKGKKDPKGAISRSGVNHSTYKGVVYCFDIAGMLIHTFETIKMAADFATCGTNCIRRVIIGNRNHVKGFRFSYSKEHPIPIKIKDQSRKIVIDTITGLEYPTIAAAGRAVGVNHKTLSHYLIGRMKNKTNLIFK